MSEADVEMLKRAYPLFSLEAVAEGRLDPVFDEIAAPEFELRPPPIYPDADRSYRGREASRSFFQQLAEVWDEWRFVAEEFIDAGDHVVVTGHLHARGRASGVEVDTPAVHLWTIHGGKALRLQVYLDREEALAAAGLPPRPDG